VPEESLASYIVAEEFFGGALDQLGIQPGLVDTIGSTQQIEGELQLNLDNLAAPLVAGNFAVNLESLTSDQPRRDRRIRSTDLESSRYPLAVFVATAVENGPASYTEGETVAFQVLGDMTIRDITQPVTMDVKATLNGDTLTGVVTVPLRMSDFGFDPPNFAGLFSVADEFKAEVQFTLRER
jgi:polyisoprenoid-binding protein YceI